MKEILLTRGAVAFVDDEDYPTLSKFNWHVSGSGYASRNLPVKNGRSGQESMHRLLMRLMKGDSREVDHIDGNKLNNQKNNLRICRRHENQRNKSVRKDNKIGFKGVVASKRKFKSYISVSGKTKYLGCFKTPEEAHEVYCLAADLLYGEFANHGG